MATWCHNLFTPGFRKKLFDSLVKLLEDIQEVLACQLFPKFLARNLFLQFIKEILEF
jgi:hypothetical protein